MMTLQILSKDKELVYEIADLLLNERLIASAIINENSIYKDLDENNAIKTHQSFSLKAISKSLLFPYINDRLRELYGNRTPLVYSEPIILIDTKQTEELVDRLVKV